MVGLTAPRPWPSTGASGWSRLLRALSARRAALLPTRRTRRASTLPWLTLAATSTLLSSCCSPEVVIPPDPAARPTLPARAGPSRATDEDLRSWARARRVDLLVAEVLRERAWADALERDGEWER